MAKTSLINKSKRTPKFAVRRYHRCRLCGRPRGVLTQVCDVPHLFSRPGLEGRDSRCDQIELVSSHG